MLEKGFIGPIGDDLPSLIPVLLGLVIFFSTFTITFNAFDQRNTEFKTDIALMRIARVLQSNSYIYSHDKFNELCNEIGTVKLRYVAMITSDAVEGKKVGNIFDIEAFRDSGNLEYICSNTSPPSVHTPAAISDYITVQQASGTKLVSRLYPIVAEDDKVVKPLHLVVVAWQ